MIGARVQPRRPVITSLPSMSGSPRSSTTASGGRLAAALSASAPLPPAGDAVAPGGDVVAWGGGVDGERRAGAGLVLDDQHPAHFAAASGRRSRIVSPP